LLQQRLDPTASMALQHKTISAIEAEIDEEDIESLMHDNDKVASSAVGTLVQTKDMTEINHFFEGQALLKKVC